MWGCQWYQDDQVMSLKANTFVAGGNPSLDEIALHAPQQGLLEVALGINRILLWQGINLNIAAAYQITPASAPYHKVGWDNLDLLIGAALYL